MPVITNKVNIKKQLKEIFGFNSFRGNQETIICNIMAGKNTFVIMPTGAGKSLCYQFPAVISDGLVIVISPLIALMKNQVDHLVGHGINACFLNSTLSKSEIKRIKKDSIENKIKLLYIAPESLTKEEHLDFLQKTNLSFVAVDEAHCISEWGHDFRPEYRKIKSMIGQLGNLPVIALTATAAPKVRLDIQKNLQMEDANVFMSSFNRKNLFYEVVPRVDPNRILIKFLKEHANESGIIYCLSRKKVEEIAILLNVNDFKAAPYHAGLESEKRGRHQDAFLNEEVNIIVATIAFGMGIDKPDVRFVIHYDVPKSIEGYYQETGRAGRDGMGGRCMMLYDPADLDKMEKFNKDKSVQERENARTLLQEMRFFAESPLCRRRQLLHYFGESFDEKDCQACDNCVNPRKKEDKEAYVKLALEAAIQTGERFELNHLINVLCGIEDEYITSYNHNKLAIFKSGIDKTPLFWRSVIRQILVLEYFAKDIKNTGILKVTPIGKKFLSQPHPIYLYEELDYSQMPYRKKEEHSPINTENQDFKLFEMLNVLRKEIAKRENLPPYVIFQESSLVEMATTYPTTKDQLATITGVGAGKIKRYGKAFLSLIQSYVGENDIEVASDIVVKSSINKSRMKIFIIQQIDRKVDLEEIANAKKISFEELLTEIENICYSGTKLNIDYYINQIIEEGRQEEVYDHFLNAETDDITSILDGNPNANFLEEELRMVRIKFISEYAN